ncbi:DUF2218 domain-containing protein [Stutzerimonas zhaodongensis]|uniref:DUF2218 domain-containing protein n=1 Tax=Stutzerimonas zhaodongensis TaxID=1176257 RepID=A0A3M2HTQ1_9GAMM|nr:DUF2218 domain-containing protein [Stutzerimonas zhaodongensis]MCQ4316027.1 DUF2218 domain-containing protein [Stutzerimonas zhaodongensis]RMH89164.1 DUF2218 domain-containing protein [Stutzerimonas zhaodongensis]
MFESHTHVVTANAERLTKRLSNHWRHKFPVETDSKGAEIKLPIGVCGLQSVDGGLGVRVQAAEEDQLERLQTVVADHLQRMAGDEALTFAWS